jgi:hypothetical protein
MCVNGTYELCSLCRLLQRLNSVSSAYVVQEKPFTGSRQVICAQAQETLRPSATEAGKTGKQLHRPLALESVYKLWPRA